MSNLHKEQASQDQDVQLLPEEFLEDVTGGRLGVRTVAGIVLGQIQIAGHVVSHSIARKIADKLKKPK